MATQNEDPIGILKLEYQMCRNKIDDIDKILKDIRFQGITVTTGFTGAVGLLFNLKYWAATLIVSIFVICLIFILWGYDHKYFMFQLGVVKRAQELEEKVFGRHFGFDGKKMISHVLTDEYRKLPVHTNFTSAIIYTLFIIVVLVIMIISSSNMEQMSFIYPLILLITFLFSVYMIWMWYLRWEAEKRGKMPLKNSGGK